MDAKDNEIFIRHAVLSDLPFLRELFRDSVLSINPKDYSAERLQAWASVWENEDLWIRKFNDQLFFIAEIRFEMAGFVSLSNNNYIDFLYVHKDFKRRGVAGKLLETIERHAIQNLVTLLETDSSLTALHFFMKNGFVELQRKTVEVNGVSMDNYALQKKLT